MEFGVPTCSLSADGVPYVAVVVVVAGDQEPAGPTEGHGGDAADDVVVVVHAQLLITADIEKTTRRVVGPRRECVTVRKELVMRTKT